MIVTIQGTLKHIQPPSVIIDVGGIGYEVFVSMQTIHALPLVNEGVFLHTQLLIKEDAHLLYGFNTPAEKNIFNDLIKVSGVGAKTALAMLSGLSLERLCLAIEQKNTSVLSSIPGIGAKTAERIALELAKKASKWQSNSKTIEYASQQFISLGAEEDAILALVGLGYSEKDAMKAVALAHKQLSAVGEKPSLNDLITYALRQFAK
jgi:holliday junction DNA helicase RuvA